MIHRRLSSQIGMRGRVPGAHAAVPDVQRIPSMMKMIRVQLPALIACLLILAGCAADRDVQTPSVDTRGSTMAGTGGETMKAAVGVDAGPDMDSAAVVPAIAHDTAAAVVVPVSDTRPAEAPQPVHVSSPVTFEVNATVMGETIYLKSTELSDAAGAAYVMPPGKSDAVTGEGALDMKMARFAHFGRADSPFAFQWVLYLPNDQGELTIRPLSRKGKKAEVTLRGWLHFDVLLKGATEPLKMKTRVMPEFKGISENGSPYGVKLTLANGPVGFYREEYIDDTTFKPMVKVVSTTFTFGRKPTKYFTKLPEITSAVPVNASGKPWTAGKVDGVNLEWANTAGQVEPLNVEGYNIYRSATPEKPGSWKLIASVPASQHSLHDKEYDGSKRMAYRVTHRLQYPIRLTYESVARAPVIVEAVK